MTAPVKQSIIFDVKTPQESSGLNSIINELTRIDGLIKGIQQTAARGLLSVGNQFKMDKGSIEKQIVEISKSAGLKGKVALEEIFKGLKIDPGIQKELIRVAGTMGNQLKNSFKLNTTDMSWTRKPSDSAMAGAVQKIFSEYSKQQGAIFKSLLTPEVSAKNISVKGATATVEGDIKLVIPAKQIQAVIEGNIQVAGGAAGGGGNRGSGRGRGATRMGTYSWPPEGDYGSSEYDRPKVPDYREQKMRGAMGEFEAHMTRWAEQYRKDQDLAARSVVHSASIGGSGLGIVAGRKGEQVARDKAWLEQEKVAREQLDAAVTQMARDEKLRQASIQESVTSNYNARLAAIKNEEQAISHRYNLERERMAILSGPDAKIAQSRAYGVMASDYTQLSKMPGMRPADRLRYQQQAEILAERSRSMQIMADRDPEAKGGNRWLATGVKGWTPAGLAKNILTVSAWTAAISAMYAPLQLAQYSIQRMIDVGLQTQRLAQVFKGVGGNAQELTADVMKLAVATGQSTDAAMEAAIGWSRFGLSRKDVVEATRVSMMAANTANIPAELATERMSAIYSDYGLNVSQLSGALGEMEHTANTAKVSVKDLMDAVMISGSAARQSGISFAEFQGIVGATVSRTSQSGNRIGTAFKSVLGSIYNPDKQELLRMDYGIETRNKEGGLKSAEEIFRAMFVAYERMDETQKKTFSYAVGDKQQANRFVAMMNSYAQAQNLAFTAQTNLNTAEEANLKIMQSQHAQLIALRSEWDKFVVTSTNAKGGGSFMTSLLTGGIGAIAGFFKGGGLTGALRGGAAGFGVGSLTGLTDRSSFNESLIDYERFGRNLLQLSANPVVAGGISGSLMGRAAGGAARRFILSNRGMAVPLAETFGISRTALAGVTSRLGPIGLAAGAVLGAADGLHDPVERGSLLIERVARRGYGFKGEMTQGQIAGRVITEFLHSPIRSFNALMDSYSNDPYSRFADERNRQIESQQQAGEAYKRGAATISAISSTLTMPGVTNSEKIESIKGISGILGPGADQILGLVKSGNFAEAQQSLAGIATMRTGQSKSSMDEAIKIKSEGVALANAQIESLQKGISAGGNTDADLQAKQKINELQGSILDDQEHINALKSQENELDSESADHLSQKSRTMVQLANGILEAQRALSDLTPGLNASDELDRQNALLKTQADLYGDLSARLRSNGNTALADDFLKKQLDTKALIAVNDDPSVRARAIESQNTSFALNRYQQASENSAIGFTESEKMISRLRYDQNTGTTTNDDTQRYAAEKDFHQTRIQLVTRYNQLLSEQKQLHIDIQREFGKSLLFGDPGDLLTKLSAMRMQQRGLTSGDWFASAGNVRQQLDILNGGEQGRTNRRERGAILGYFGGRMPTLSEEQTDIQRKYFERPPKLSDVNGKDFATKPNIYEHLGINVPKPPPFMLRDPNAHAAGESASATLEITRMATALNSNSRTLDDFQSAVERATKSLSTIPPTVQKSGNVQNTLTLPGNLGATGGGHGASGTW